MKKIGKGSKSNQILPSTKLFLQVGLHETAYTRHFRPYQAFTFVHQLKQLIRQYQLQNVVYQTALPVNRKRMKAYHFKMKQFNNVNIQRINEQVITQIQRQDIPMTHLTLVNGYWSFPADDNLDGIHSVQHAMHPA